MFKLAIKISIFTLIVLGAGIFLPGNKVEADSGQCPSSFSDAQNNLHWGVSPQYNGSHGGNMAGLIIHAYDASNNQNIDTQFKLDSGISPTDPDWGVINGAQTNLNARIFEDIDGDFSNRTNSYQSYTNSTVGVLGTNGASCTGWDAFGPIGLDTNQVGNGYVLDCGPFASPTHFWFSGLRPTPIGDGANGASGYWSINVNGPSGSYTIPHYTEGSSSFASNYFEVTNGENVFVNMIWHPTGWSLDGTTTVNGQQGTIYKPAGSHVTFNHSVTNNGPNTATYNWTIKEQQNGGGFSEYGNQDSNGDINVGVGNNGPDPPNGSKAIGYDIPSNAPNGYKYCQRIDYSNANGPGSATQNSQPACVIVGSTPPSHSLGCSETNYNVSHQGGHRQYIQLTGTDSDGSYYVSPDGSGRDSIDLDYTALAQTVHVYIHRYTWNGSTWVEDAGSPADHSYGCYHAACTGVYYDGDGPWDGSSNPDGTQHHIVQAGHAFKVYVPVTNNNGDPSAETINSNAGGHNFSLTEPPDDYQGGFAEHDTGFSLNVGDTQTKEIDFPANGNTNSVRSLNLSFYPDYYGYGSLGDGCSVGVKIYQNFNASLSSSSVLSPTIENPYNGDDYSTTINVKNDSNQVIYIPTSSSFFKKPASGGNVGIDSNSGGNYGSSGGGVSTNTLANHYNVPTPYQAGDEYCAQIHANYTTGYIGPGGANDVVGAGNPADSSNCPRIADEPYFKANNADISAGGDFNKCTSSGGLLAGYADIGNGNQYDVHDPSEATRGSSTNLSALALLKITGVASDQPVGYINNSPAGLTFANTGTGVQVDSTGTESPILGGSFNDSNNTACLTLPNASQPDNTATTSSSSFSVSGASGNYKRSGNLTITGGSLGANQNVAIYVNGDAYIKSNITYASTGWDVGTAPSFIIHATGNIYVAPGVTKLAGTYIGEHKIYDCATASGTTYRPVSTQNLYTSCKNQLLVSGNFVADQVNLMRTFGSLRDETPNPATTADPGTPDGPATPWGFVWSSSGSHPKGNNCVEMTDALTDYNHYDYTLYDNWLCVPNSTKLKMAWTFDANGPGCNSMRGWSSLSCLQSTGYPYCAPFNTGEYSWDDNWLCFNKNVNPAFSTAPVPGRDCTRLIESSDPEGNWRSGYYICVDMKPGAPGIPPTQAQPPSPKTSKYKDCSGAGGTQVTTTSCSAEVFQYVPTLYLGRPGIGGSDGSSGANGGSQFQSLTSLPPVL